MIQKGRCDILTKRVQGKKWDLRSWLYVKIMFASEYITVDSLFLYNYDSVQCKQFFFINELLSHYMKICNNLIFEFKLSARMQNSSTVSHFECIEYDLSLFLLCYQTQRVIDEQSSGEIYSIICILL